MVSPILEAAIARRERSRSEMERMISAAEARGTKQFTDPEVKEFEKLAKSIKKDDATIEQLRTEEHRSEKAYAAVGEFERGTGRRGVYITGEPQTYGPDLKHSYFRDMALVACSGVSMHLPEHPVSEALDRIQRHRKEVEVEARSNPELDRRLVEMRLTPQSLRRESRVSPNTTDGTGGEFVPPLWLVDQYVPYARAGRVIANRMRQHPLPPGTDSINLPKMLTGTATAVQSAQPNPVQSTDMTTSTVSAAVITIAGQQDVSVQLIDQSPISMDQVIWDDLTADYDMQLDRQVLYGTGTNGQHRGIFAQTAASANTTNTLNTDQTKINAVTCASAIFWDGTTGTSFTQYRSILNGITNIQTLRYMSPTAIYAHPRRVNSWSYASDATTGRPLFTRYGVMNGLGQPTKTAAEGVVGELAGYEVVQDANIPITCSTGSITSGTGDMIGIVKEDDMILYEGQMRLRALPEVLSGTLQVRLQSYCYSAFIPNRFPASATLVTGTTGLAAAVY